RYLRRAVRDPHAGADRQAVEEDRSRPLRPRLLEPGVEPEADGGMGRHCGAGSRPADLRRHAVRRLQPAARSPDHAPSRARNRAGGGGARHRQDQGLEASTLLVEERGPPWIRQLVKHLSISTRKATGSLLKRSPAPPTKS